MAVTRSPRAPSRPLWPLIAAPSSRLFSLHVPLPPKVFLSMVYKLEGPSDVRVALELTTGDADSCHIGGISALNGEDRGWLAPLPSEENRCMGPGSWCWRCWASPATAVVGAMCCRPAQGSSPVSVPLAHGAALSLAAETRGAGPLPAVAWEGGRPRHGKKPGE